MQQNPFHGLSFSCEQFIEANKSIVWKYLTDSDLVRQWMSDDHKLTISSDWQQGSSIIIEGELAGQSFSNEGTIVEMKHEKILRYEYVNSLSAAHYNDAKNDWVEFRLEEQDGGTKLYFRCHTSYTEI